VTVARCSFLVLGEDSATDAPATLVALARKILRLVDSYHDEQHVRFEPPPAKGTSVGAALRGNLWKSKEPRDYAKRRDLIGYIATKLLEGERAFVIYHVDGDRRWSERESGENARKFRDFIETDVRQFIEHRLRQTGRPPGEISVAQLLLLVPHYSLESWLFQNAQTGRRLCQENAACKGAHVELFNEWEKDRTILDEEVKPKERVCFRGDHNQQLVGGLDVEAVYWAERSLHATVNALMANEPLVRALASTRPG
jgi:hypothetical protein